jgi:hypothetical protein
VLIPLIFNIGPLALSPLRTFLFIMIVPMAVRLLSGRYGRVLAVDVLFPLHMAWATIALAVNNPDRVVEQAGSVGLEFLGGYLIGRSYIRSAADFVALARWIGLIMVCLLPFTIFETLTGRSILLEALQGIPGFRAVATNSSEARLGLERVQATFAHPIHWGLFGSMALSLTYVALKDRIGEGWRFLVSAVSAISGFLALSSGALLALVLQLGLFIWAWAFRKVKARWWLLVGLFAVMYVVIDPCRTGRRSGSS